MIKPKNYELVRLMFERKHKFTKWYLLSSLEDKGYLMSEEEIEIILKHFCEKGLITDYGSYYAIA